MSHIRNAKERVERLTANPVAPLSFAARIATAGGPGETPAAELDGVVVDGRLHVPELRLGPAERLLVTGPNGAGKSTLLRVLAGELRPDAGTVGVPGRVGHLRQEETPWPPGLTVLEAFAQGRPGDRDEHADRLLSLGLFEPEALRLRVGELSYGQWRRIELGRLVSEPVDLLLLDEPTNHLSPSSWKSLRRCWPTTGARWCWSPTTVGCGRGARAPGWNRARGPSPAVGDTLVGRRLDAGRGVAEGNAPGH